MTYPADRQLETECAVDSIRTSHCHRVTFCMISKLAAE